MTIRRSTRAGVASRLAVAGVLTALALIVLTSGLANADNKRLNDSVVANVYTLKRQAGCTNDMRISPKLQLAAQWHADDMINNRDLAGDNGSDGSSVQDRARNADYSGVVAETVAIHPAFAINGIDIMSNWYFRSDYYAIMSNCANTEMGVWSNNSVDRSVVVAVYGQPA